LAYHYHSDDNIDADTIKLIVKSGVDLSNSDESVLFWRSIENSIVFHNNDLFHFLLEVAKEHTDEFRSSAFTKSNGYIFALKVALESYNYDVVKHILETQNKPQIINPKNWGDRAERTILNFSLVVMAGEFSQYRSGYRNPYRLYLEHKLSSKDYLYKQRIKIISYIIDYDSQVNIPTGKERRLKNEFPLHLELAGTTFLNDDVKILSKLLNNGANPNVQNALGFTPLHKCNNEEQVKTLLAFGADMNIKNCYGNTAAESAELTQSSQPFNIPTPFDNINN